MSQKIFIAAVFITLAVVGCKKENNTEKEGTRLKRRVVSSTLFGASVDSFLYDTQNRLIEIRTSHNQQYDIRIEYEASGQLSRVIYNFLGTDHYYTTFIRNSSGQVIHKTSVPFPGFDHAYDESFTYNSLGQLVSDTTYFKQTDSILYYSSMKYDNNGNIIETDFVDLINSTNRGKTVYILDANPNPLNLQGSNIFFVTGDHSYLNRNNIVEMRPWFTPPLKSQLTYQKNKLPGKIVTEYPDSPFGPYTVTLLLEYW